MLQTLVFLFLILCPLQAPTARNETLAQHPDPTCFRGHALTMPAEQLVLLTAAPPDKGEFEATKLTGKELSIYLFLIPRLCTANGKTELSEKCRQIHSRQDRTSH